MENFLEHHGIKGQQWGVSHGPPYPLDKKTSVLIKKGTELHSTMTSKKIKTDSSRNLYAYDSSDEADSNAYKGLLARFKQKHGEKNVFDHTFVTTEDLLLPSQTEKVNVFKDLYKNDPYVKDYMDETKQYYKDEFPSVLKYYEDMNKNTKDKIDIDYKLFVSGANMADHPVKQKFIDALKTKGYNAMIDDNDVLSGLSHNPLVIFSQASLEHVGKKGRKLTEEEIQKHYDKVDEAHKLD